MIEHIGLLVYNVFNGTGTCAGQSYSMEGVPVEGVHIWGGEAWEHIPADKVNIEKDVRTHIDHGMNTIDGIRVGSFTMSYNDGTDSEEDTYYYADYGIAGIWMTQNLRTQFTPQGIKMIIQNSQTVTGKDNDGNRQYRVIYPASLGNSTNPALYEENRKNGKELGLLYDWYTATDHHNCSTIDQRQVGTLNDTDPTAGDPEVENKEPEGYIRGICPEGWHIPSDREWSKLEKFLTENASLYTQEPVTANGTWPNGQELNTLSTWRGTINGTVMKSTSVVENPPRPITNANPKAANNGGFDAFMVGSSTSRPYSYQTYFWTSSTFDASYVWYRSLSYNDSTVFRWNTRKNFFSSVRCKKN